MMWPKVPNIGSSPTRVGLVTLSAPDAARNPEFVARGLQWLQARRSDVVWARHARAEKGYLAASPQELADDLTSLIEDPDVDLIFTTGGGTNANSLLPFIKPESLRANPKPIIGLSNTTVLLNYLASASGVVTFHGPVLVWNLGGETPPDEYTEQHLLQALLGAGPLSVQAEPSWRWLRAGAAEGTIWGGNLWSFQQLLGTPFLPDLSGAILFIEECFTELHNVAAALAHLDQAGILAKISGLVVGIPLECLESEYADDRDFDAVVLDACAGYDFPILAGVNLGHTDRKITVPLGSRAHIDSTRNQLEFREPRCTISPQAAVQRGALLSRLRQKLNAEDFLEVTTPILLKTSPHGPEPTQKVEALGTIFDLRSSIELSLRTALKAAPRVYDIGPAIRFEDAGKPCRSSVEFTLLELYMSDPSFEGLIEFADQLLREAVPDLPAMRQISVSDWFRDHLKLDFSCTPKDEIRSRLQEICGLREVTRIWELVNKIVGDQLEPTLNGLVFLVEYPLETVCLARRNCSRPHLIDRFEIFINGLEVGHGFLDEMDPDNVLARMCESGPQFIDRDFVGRLRRDELPKSGGFGLGIERLLASTLGAPTRDVRQFIHAYQHH